MTKEAHNFPIGDSSKMYSITELAHELGVTPRTLRFYEDKGLLKPQRVGGTRVYVQRDRARVIIILRGKRLGFSLKEIGEYLDLYDADPTQRSQIDRLLDLVRDRITLLEQQRDALEETLSELREIEQLSLNAIEREKKSAGIGGSDDTTSADENDPPLETNNKDEKTVS